MSVAEVRVVDRVQRLLGRGPVPASARALSRCGEHGLGWYAVGALGAAVDRERRALWIHVGLSAFTAHAAAVVIKRVVRRRRPDPRLVTPLVSTPSELSFPSAHATSTAAAAAALAPLAGAPVAVGIVGAMTTSRVVVGVHYPTDVAAGVVVGLLTERVLRAVRRPGGRP